MPSTVNPYYTARRSAPMSHFVDQSLPTELMLKAGAAKQEQQNQMMSLIDQAGLWDLDNIGGGDKELVDRTRKKVEEFVDQNNSRDLTSSSAQRDVKKFLSKLTTDTNLKQVTLNKKKVDQMNDTITKLRAAGNQEFDPSVKLAQRRLDAYLASGREGEEFDKIDIEKALALHAAEAKLFDQLKEFGGQEFTKNIKGLPSGFTGKRAWKTITDERIRKRANQVADGYMATPEGQQALALYREHVLDYQNSLDTNPGLRNEDRPGINPQEESAKDFIIGRLIDAGMEYEKQDESVSMQRSYFPTSSSSNNNKKTPPADPIIIPKQTTTEGDKDETDIDELRGKEQELREQGNIVEADKVLAQIQDRENYTLNTPEAQGINESLKNLVTGNTGNLETSIPQATAQDFATKALDPEGKGEMVELDYLTRKYLNRRLKAGEALVTKESVEKAATDLNSKLAPIYEALSKYMPDLINSEILEKHNPHFAYQMKQGSTFHPDYQVDKDGKIVHGVTISGTDARQGKYFGLYNKQHYAAPRGKFVSYKEMGVAEEDLTFLSGLRKNAGAEGSDTIPNKKFTTDQGSSMIMSEHDTENKPWVDMHNTLQGKLYKKLMNNASGIYSSDNMVYNDATDDIFEKVEKYNELIEKQDGREARQLRYMRASDKKTGDAIDYILSSANWNNYEVVNPGGGVMDAEEQQKILRTFSNAGASKLTVDAGLGRKELLVRINKGTDAKPDKESYTIREKTIGGLPQRSQSFDKIYANLSEGSSELVGSVDMVNQFTLNNHQPIMNVLKGYAGSWKYGNNFTVRKNREDVVVTGTNEDGVTTRVQGTRPFILGTTDANGGTADVTYGRLYNAVEALEKRTGLSAQAKNNLRQTKGRYFINAAIQNGFSRDDAAQAFEYKESKSKPGFERDVDKQKKLTQVMLSLTNPATARNYFDLQEYGNLMTLSAQTN